LFDLRNHGEAPRSAPPHTLEACADDLDRRGSASVVIGHSFGGKVALTWARRCPERLEQGIILDTQPGIAHVEASRTVRSVIAALRQVPIPARDRSDVRSYLTNRGLSEGIVAWLLTSLRRTPSGWRWTYDLDGVDEMMRDYWQTDLWPWLEARKESLKIDMVRAARSEIWSAEIVARILQLPASSAVRFHTLEDAGHWLHVDNPEGLLDLLTTTILRH